MVKKYLTPIVLLIISTMPDFSQPVIQWEKEYNGTGNSIDKIITVKQDPTYYGYVYVCGYVTNAGSGIDIITIKYDQSGNILWSAVYNGTGNSTDYPADIDINSNVVYMCGSSFGVTGNYDIIYQTYNYSTGAVIYSGRFNGAANADDFAASIRGDAAGGRVVSGITTNSSGNTDMIILGYGTWISQVIYNGSANRNETGGLMKFKNNNLFGNYILSGATEISAAEKHLYIAEYNRTTGAVVWSQTESVISGINEVKNFEFGASSGIMVYGSCPVTPSPSAVFIKHYTSGGISGQTYIHSHQSVMNDKAVSMKIDNTGNIYITGYTFRNGSNDYITFKLNSSLILQWNNYYNGPLSGNDIPGMVSADNSGNTIVTGTSPGTGTGSDLATIWYDAYGTERWVQRYNGTSNANDEGAGIIMQPSGQFTVIGSSTSPGTDMDIKVIKYSDGALPVTLSEFSAALAGRSIKLIWKTASEINNSGFDVERMILKKNNTAEWEKAAFVRGNGTTTEPHVYSFEDKNLNTGTYRYRLKQMDFNGNHEYFILNSPAELTIGSPVNYELSQNYPNPSNPNSRINFSVPYDSRVSLKVFDMLGREIGLLIDGFVTAGYHSVEFNGSDLSSGIYFYKFEARSFIETKKMILIK